MSDERYAFRCSCGCSLVSTLPGSANCPDCDKEMEPADAIPTPAPTAPTAPALGQTIGRLVYGGRGTPNPHPVRFRMEQIAAASAVAAEARRTAPAPTAPAQPQGRSDREQVALALAALPIGKRKRVLVEALRADDSMRAEVFAVVSSLGHLREYGGQLTVAEARERVVRLAKFWESSTEAGAPDALMHAVMELKDAEEADPAATAPTQPAPGVVEALAQVLDEANAAAIRAQSAGDVLYVPVPWTEKSEVLRERRRAMAAAAIAWAERAYGGQVAALRGALLRLVQTVNRTTFRDERETEEQARAALVAATHAGADAVNLTPAQAGEAVQALAETLRDVRSVLVSWAHGTPSRLCLPDCKGCAAIDRIDKALAPFVARGGGER